jgi:hypothetical protein
MFTAPEYLCTPAAILSRNVVACFGLAGFCFASPYYQHNAAQWLAAGLRQMLELRIITA